MEKKIKYIVLTAILFLGFLIRIFFVDKVLMGDLLINAEWGQKIVERGTKSHYYSKDWYYTSPVYPPFSQLVFGSLRFAFDHRYLLAELHNTIKIPPSAFIIYFYEFGYFLLLKLPGILGDLGIALIIYKVVSKLTNSIKKGLVGAAIYVFNPITVFLSGIWGQTDSFVGLLGMASFLLLISKNIFFSLPLLFLSLYFKPSWAVFLPFYLYLLITMKPGIKSLILGVAVTFLTFLITTLPFTEENVFVFAWNLFTQKIPLPWGIIGKASNSAFNFYTVFLRIDIDSPPKFIELISLLVINIVAITTSRKVKDKLLSLFSGLFIIGIGSFIFMTSMLERYFFPGLAPLIVLSLSRPTMFVDMVIMNLVFFLNIAWSFYRRTSDEIGRPFVVNNFLVIKVLSVTLIVVYLHALKMLQFEGAKSKY